MPTAEIPRAILGARRGVGRERARRYPAAASGPSLDLVGWGRLAAEALAEPGPVRIAAAFRRSFYLETARGRLVCIGWPEIGRGPLNALAGAAAVAANAWPAVRPGDRAAIAPGSIELAGGRSLTFAGAVVWEPAELPPTPGAETLRAALGALLRWAEARHRPALGPALPAALGLGAGRGDGARPRAPAAAVVEPADEKVSGLRLGSRSGSGARATSGHWPARGENGPGSLPEAAARRIGAGVEALAGWLAERWGGGPGGAAGAAPDAPPPAAAALLGLGPGLTPSGDDVIGGALLGLYAFRRTGLVRQLGRWALAGSRGRTGDVSRAHLRAAARGMGAEPVHRALHCLLTAGAPGLSAALADAAAVGRSSGLDTLAGVVCVFDAALRRPLGPDGRRGG